ncbi:Glycosyltransferase involved in cell wall bisynthesis [Catalinimonas alkaloidigena]|uniref:Glycosyltransferase involved in cell wall bisynthesis n=1 Tax=Catalinimonas alkaloidigena TaxID=1075417 RepID=A0A1G9LEW8_9BACT|nr:glycosyltransferase family 4 protein [Catalinimonas alkaloidigena]SDL60414.1 Glycosyltransferase involved in cell wall bisynthesis [Catalinimonas alkaloidigena]
MSLTPSEEHVLLVWNRIGDYHRARWQALAQQLGTDRVFGADLGAADLLYKWESTDQTQATYVLLSEQPVDQADLLTRIKRFRRVVQERRITTVCLSGYGQVEYRIFIAIARRMGCRVILFAESWYGTNPWVNRIKRFFFRRWVDGWLVSGVRAQAHFVNRLGIDPTRIRTGYSVVDNHHFAQGNKAKDSSLPTLLCVARFSEEKNLTALLKAFRKSRLIDQWRLQLVGGGPQQKELETLATHPHTQLHGWVAYAQLPDLYAQADAFVLPSVFEPWGLVVNEAMAAGLPVLVSEQCGCAPDLVSSENGWVFDAEKEETLVAVLNQLAEVSVESLRARGKRSQEIIQHFTPDTWASAIVALLQENPSVTDVKIPVQQAR